ncbi:hypothetical protein [Reyranella sp.]|uniref:hypothetical protein n=1 Tax=Reyranella sp. TaxID=1929291 RepID=UPI003D0D3FA4
MKLEAGRHDGLTGPRPEDTAAERAALEDHGRITDAASPARMVDPEGRLLPWQEAILSSLAGALGRRLAFPVKE